MSVCLSICCRQLEGVLVSPPQNKTKHGRLHESGKRLNKNYSVIHCPTLFFSIFYPRVLHTTVCTIY